MILQLQQIAGKELVEETVNTFDHKRVAPTRSFLQMMREYVSRTQNDIRMSKEKLMKTRKAIGFKSLRLN